MSDFFGDDFTAELRKYFLESFLKDVENCIDLIDEKHWQRIRTEVIESVNTWMVDAQTNEFENLSVWLQKSGELLEKVESGPDLHSALFTFKSYIQELLLGQKDSPELAANHILNKASQKDSLLLHCKIGNQDFAIPVEHVLEITSKLTQFLSPLPEEKISGLVAFRGEPVPVINLLDLGFQKEHSQPSIFVVCECQKIRFVLNVDQAEDFLTLTESQIQNLNAQLIEAGSCINRVVHLHNRNIMLLDLERLVAA